MSRRKRIEWTNLAYVRWVSFTWRKRTKKEKERTQPGKYKSEKKQKFVVIHRIREQGEEEESKSAYIHTFWPNVWDDDDWNKNTYVMKKVQGN